MVRTYHYFLTIALLLAGFALTAAASENEAGIVALLSDFCLVAGFVGAAWLLDKALWRLLTEDR
ncbi:MAG: hypothetical protein AAF674_21830 [Pseudomonadota bacterium]